MAVWEDVVTTGLIGTDRRPVPDELPRSWGAELEPALDPAHSILMLAARHRALARAGSMLPSSAPGGGAPPNGKPLAGQTAHEILARLLSPPQVDLLNLWLRSAAEHDQLAAAAYWTPLAMVAARTTELDRAALAKAVGDRGVWFIEQNPQWTRLAKSLRTQAPDEAPLEGHTSGTEVTEDAVRANPKLILRPGVQWTKRLNQTVLAIIGSGQLQQFGARYAAEVGTRMPLQHYELMRSAAQQIARQDVSLTPAGLRSVREALLALERTVWLRIEMRSAFSGKPIMVERLEIPQW
jgi:hypothetical protein